LSLLTLGLTLAARDVLLRRLHVLVWEAVGYEHAFAPEGFQASRRVTESARVPCVELLRDDREVVPPEVYPILLEPLFKTPRPAVELPRPYQFRYGCGVVGE